MPEAPDNSSVVQVEEQPAKSSLRVDGFDTFSFGVLACFLLLMVFIGYNLVRSRMRKQRELERIQDASFEAQMRRYADSLVPTRHVPGPVPGRYTPPSEPEESCPDAMAVAEIEALHTPESQPQSAKRAQPSRPEAPTAGTTAVTGAADVRRAADEVCSLVIAQLRNANLLDRVDDYIELNGNPQGAAILRMRNGRRALLVPYFETDIFAERNLKRFDYLIFVGRNGRAVMLKRLEDWLAEAL